MLNRGGRPVPDITGVRFGKLIAVERAGSDVHKFALWQCACDCGGTVVARGNSLRDGSRKSCGCARRALRGAVLTPRAKAERVLNPGPKKRRLALIRQLATRRAA